MISSWASLETPLDPAPRFYIESPDSFEANEAERQALFVAKARRAGLIVVAVNNGAKRGQRALNEAKRLGAMWGFPDVIVFHAGRVACLEFKNGKTHPSFRQVECLNRLVDAGIPCGAFRTAARALGFLAGLGFHVDGAALA